MLPALEYDHSNGQCAIIGGFVYRGTKFPALQGQYFYADLCAGWVRSFTYGGTVTSQTSWNLNVTVSSPVSFGEDAKGELYLLTGGGSVYRIGP